MKQINMNQFLPSGCTWFCIYDEQPLVLVVTSSIGANFSGGSMMATKTKF